jgi:hypothetical protein
MLQQASPVTIASTRSRRTGSAQRKSYQEPSPDDFDFDDETVIGDTGEGQQETKLRQRQKGMGKVEEQGTIEGKGNESDEYNACDWEVENEE